MPSLTKGRGTAVPGTSMHSGHNLFFSRFCMKKLVGMLAPCFQVNSHRRGVNVHAAGDRSSKSWCAAA